MALNVLVKVAIEQRGIEAVCADLTDVVDSNTPREALADCIPHETPRRGLR